MSNNSGITLILLTCAGLLASAPGFAANAHQGRVLNVQLNHTHSSHALLSPLADLGVPGVSQDDPPYLTWQNSEWCWAASTAMVVDYYTQDDLQACDVASLIATDTNGTPNGFCCNNPQQCDVPGGPQFIGDVFDKYDVTGTLKPVAFTFDQVVTEIEAQHPIIASMTNPSSQVGHYLVISGYFQPDQVVVIDPEEGQEKTIAFNELFDYDNEVYWAETITTSYADQNGNDPGNDCDPTQSSCF